MSETKEKTAQIPAVGAAGEQSFPNNITVNNIAEKAPEFNDEFLREEQRRLFRLLDPHYLNTVSMTELYENVYQSKPPLIDGMLYPGVQLFAGPPKLGKSFFMAQLAYHVSKGTPLWGYPVRRGTVLYLALEDDYGRLQKRLYQMFGVESTDNLYFSVSAGQIGNGLDEQLENFVREHPDTVLIIIDTLQKVREMGGDKYSYANDYDIITRLKNFADSKGICLILVHHTRKQQADDPYDMISGTNGLMGAADGAFLLKKEKRTANAATLDVSGRDIQDQRFYLKRNTERLIWELEKIETEPWREPPEPLLAEVAKHINAEQPDWEGTSTEFIELLGLDVQPNTLTYKLNVNAGRLLDEYHIQYSSSRNHNGRKVKFHYEQTE
ncbi:hypothetical protein SELR_04480 [Selenomonas ruminantium subsp. lactilytica TAM6421]|uniref:AAA domain-containing protein n=1 Tax=Selenomonas ruminantium subsp. lactilytica (strain NBRC 103574 / TAM6421) TaxID=927704 RepID=I0GN19_SELRL|nr:helicase RepA family protein [Selenomonas ruminantium]BAL82156.1 hypothetical protein SELR_04480 [Selenomonas ruminantium subsp. lactilytica TAM6421]